MRVRFSKRNLEISYLELRSEGDREDKGSLVIRRLRTQTLEAGTMAPSQSATSMAVVSPSATAALMFVLR